MASDARSAMVNIRGSIKAYARVTVFMVVPVEKCHGKGSGIFKAPKSAWELRTVFHGFKLAFRERGGDSEGTLTTENFALDNPIYFVNSIKEIH